MRVFLGMIIGAFLTISGAYLYDSMIVPPTAQVAQAVQTSEPRPMVNWDVVSLRWHNFRAGLHELSVRVHEGWNKLTG